MTGEDLQKLAIDVAAFLDHTTSTSGMTMEDGSRAQYVCFAVGGGVAVEVQIRWSKPDLSGPEVAKMLRNQVKHQRENPGLLEGS